MLTIKYWIFIQSKWEKYYFFLYFIPELFHYETAYSVKNMVALFSFPIPFSQLPLLK